MSWPCVRTYKQPVICVDGGSLPESPNVVVRAAALLVLWLVGMAVGIQLW